MKKVRKCVIPVAGMGTRFLPGTKAIPKEMFPIIDKPAIQYNVEEAVKSGIEEILFIVVFVLLDSSNKSLVRHLSVFISKATSFTSQIGNLKAE